MTRGELYSNIFRSILDHHADLIQNVDDIRLELDLNGTSNAIQMSLLPENRITNPSLKQLVSILGSRIKDIDIEIEENNGLIVSKLPYNKPTNKRDFIWHSSELSVVNCNILFAEHMNYSDQLVLIIEQICYQEKNRINFLNYLATNNNGGVNDYYILYDEKKFPQNKEWELYMYALSLYLNNGSIVYFDNELTYKPNLPHNTHISYNVDAHYTQYIDIYDVVNEWNRSTDVLSAFVKMYQILEYIVYRKELVEIVNGANIKQSFVRQVKGLDKRFTNDERGTFIRELKSVFNSFHGKITPAQITADMESFCKKYYPLNKNGDTYMTPVCINDIGQIDACIAKFIYDTRCSIVHSKESEFHMTTINYYEYVAIVPLMKDIMKIVGECLFDILNNVNNKITFNNPSLDLY